MTEQNKPRKSRAKKPSAPKVEAPKVEEPAVEPVAEVAEEKAPEPVENIHAPVEVEEERKTLDPPPEPKKEVKPAGWVEADHGITQHRFGMGRLKYRMRTRKSRYEQ